VTPVTARDRPQVLLLTFSVFNASYFSFGAEPLLAGAPLSLAALWPRGGGPALVLDTAGGAAAGLVPALARAGGAGPDSFRAAATAREYRAEQWRGGPLGGAGGHVGALEVCACVCLRA
jgi:hypothetical protein